MLKMLKMCLAVLITMLGKSPLCNRVRYSVSRMCKNFVSPPVCTNGDNNLDELLFMDILDYLKVILKCALDSLFN
jgi:hypothetical protein